MPKRKASASSEEKWKKKIRKYEAKLRKKSSRIIYSSEEEYDNPPPPLLPTQDLLESVINEQLELAEAVPGDLPPQDPPEPIPGPSSALAVPAQEEITPTPAEINSEIIDPELLQALGDFVPEAAEWGDDINDNLSKIWTPILRDGLKKETKEELSKKYLLPKNCPLTKAPVLNPEISAVLVDSSKNRDLRLHKKQNQLGCVLSVLGKVITGMLRRSLDTQEALKLLSDASKLVADSHFTETETRRPLITPMLERSFIDSFKDRKRDSQLFGDKLGEFIKSSRGIKKTGQLIQATSSTASSNLNWRGPPPRQFQRSSRPPLNRGGGPRAPPPPQPARRRTSAPTPPAGQRATPVAPAPTTRRPYPAAPTTRRR